MGKWVRKMEYTCNGVLFRLKKEKKILTHATKQMHLKDIVLSEID